MESEQGKPTVLPLAESGALGADDLPFTVELWDAGRNEAERLLAEFGAPPHTKHDSLATFRLRSDAE